MVARYPLNLPQSLKSKAAAQARRQGVSLNQFFLWSISEKVTELDASLDDPRFPNIVYRRGEAGTPTPVIRGTGLRVHAFGTLPSLTINGMNRSKSWSKIMT
jgi:hypothetical protein